MKWFPGQIVVCHNPEHGCDIPKGAVGVVVKDIPAGKGGCSVDFTCRKNYRMFEHEIMQAEMENE